MSNFEPTVYGQPDPSLSRDEVERIIDDARRNGQNVMFGEGWRTQQLPRTVYSASPPIRTGLLAAVAAVVGRWF